jgi:hypothetical protein
MSTRTMRVDDRDQQHKAGAARADEPAEPEDDAALILGHDLDRRQREHEPCDERDREQNEGGAIHGWLLRLAHYLLCSAYQLRFGLGSRQTRERMSGIA